MKKITCELCGGTNFVKQGDNFVCQGCGTQYSLEDTKKMLSETPDSTVVTPSSNSNTNQVQTEDEKLIILAHDAELKKNFKSAQKYYLKALELGSNSWEPKLGLSFIDIVTSKDKTAPLGKYTSVLKSIITDYQTDLKSIAYNFLRHVDIFAELNQQQKNKIIKNLEDHLEDLDLKNQTDKVKYSISIKFIRAHEYLAFDTKIFEEYIAIRDQLKDHFPAPIQNYLAESKVRGPYNVAYIVLQNELCQKDQNPDKIKEYYEKYYNAATKLKAAIPSDPVTIYTLEELKEKHKPACYIATSVYGSYDCPEVWTLRRFRDNILASTWLGRLFIKTYYAISPKLVTNFGQKSWFKSFWKKTLDCFVSDLNAKGIKNTPYNDKNWL